MPLIFVCLNTAQFARHPADPSRAQNHQSRAPAEAKPGRPIHARTDIARCTSAALSPWVTKRPRAGLGSKVPSGSVPATPAWPLLAPSSEEHSPTMPGSSSRTSMSEDRARQLKRSARQVRRPPANSSSLSHGGTASGTSSANYRPNSASYRSRSHSDSWRAWVIPASRRPRASGGERAADDCLAVVDPVC